MSKEAKDLAGKTCSELKRWGSTWSGGYSPCGKPAKVEVDGRHFCGVHDPVRRKAREAERNATWDLQREVDRKDRAMRAAAPSMAEALDKVERVAAEMVMAPGNEDAKQIILAIARAALALARGDSQ